MRYFLDTEFYEANQKIDLISIALVAEDGREYYAECNEYDWHVAYSKRWIRDMVLANLTHQNVTTRETIAKEIKLFVAAPKEPPVFWGWCCAYDYVVVSQLFGGLLSLPQNWPHHILDIQGLLDARRLTDDALPEPTGHRHSALNDARHIRDIWNWLHEPKQVTLSGQRATTLAQKVEIIMRLLALWQRSPGLRLAQLILNVFGTDFYYLEDYDFIKQIEESYLDTVEKKAPFEMDPDLLDLAHQLSLIARYSRERRNKK